ncbi:hypothetical protein OOZ19_12915 [Saccharopolyspora sp. NFXS83]|uniref:hypothetical protein n=1 Tax=Saccharopolyspora sp. NFXS83 TaxID=2993560 RepID=UPI00224A7223|nr:hypothetical protein [Saccharopolyspora sp. NFXS83]MCX2731146.1 hypothetical protein [Saccharopolyspora sp. NFXS83]
MKPWLVYASVGIASAAVTFSVLTVLHAANSLGAPAPRRAAAGDPVDIGEEVPHLAESAGACPALVAHS